METCVMGRYLLLWLLGVLLPVPLLIFGGLHGIAREAFVIR